VHQTGSELRLISPAIDGLGSMDEAAFIELELDLDVN
jgi:hypothetical protein